MENDEIFGCFSLAGKPAFLAHCKAERSALRVAWAKSAERIPMNTTCGLCLRWRTAVLKSAVVAARV
eukprot:1178659-Prorocentrum_minimum.AAC.3